MGSAISTALPLAAGVTSSSLVLLLGSVFVGCRLRVFFSRPGLITRRTGAIILRLLVIARCSESLLSSRDRIDRIVVRLGV
jgi:hypothetical protein